VFHPLENEGQCTHERVHTCGDNRLARLRAGFIRTIFRLGVCVIRRVRAERRGRRSSAPLLREDTVHGPLLLGDCLVNHKREADGHPRELDNQRGPPAEVKVGELPESVLNLKEMRDLGVQREDAGTAGCICVVNGEVRDILII
jgi:hypothetical protein